MPSHSSGRLHPHLRDTNNAAPIIGNDIQIENYRENLHENNKHKLSEATRKSYRSRIRKIVGYLEKKHPAYFVSGVRKLTTEEKNDKTKFYYKKDEYDLVYTGMNVKFIISFMLDNKLRPDGKTKGVDDIRRYKDAILWASRVQGEGLPEEFYVQMEEYLASYKRVHVQAKKKGETEDKAADPITFVLYALILGWAIQCNNIYVWVWTLMQWNCMARAISIDDIGFHNFTLGLDSLRCKYDDSKADKEGEKLSEKNMYANPYDYRQCVWTGLGVYFSINSDSLCENEKFFLRANVQPGTASHKYQEQLKNMLETKKDIVSQHCRFKHCNAYSLRKGSATHVTSGTTCPPPISSVARRGEWSMGHVLEVYWHFADTGDFFLGRILGGLDPTKASFGVLPPHWIVIDPLSDPDIKKAAEISFGKLLTRYKNEPYNPCALLIRCLACIVYQSDHLIAVMNTHPGHDFNKVPILHRRELLQTLKRKVTLEPTMGVMGTATGIPPHVELAMQTKVNVLFYFLLLISYLLIVSNSCSIQSIFDKCTEILTEVRAHSVSVVEAVKSAIDAKAWESGQMTAVKFTEIMDEFKKDILKEQQQQIDVLKQKVDELSAAPGIHQTETVGTTSTAAAAGGGCTYAYGGKFFSVPQGFKFPDKVSIKTGLNFWFCGMSIGDNNYVKPFRQLTTKGLSTKKLQDDYRLKWNSFFKHLENSNIVVPSGNTRDLPQATLDGIYSQLIILLKSRYSYCFTKVPDCATVWSIGTWAIKMTRSEVMKHGTDSDKALLPPATNKNNSNGRNKSRKRRNRDNVLYPSRQARRNNNNNANT